LSDGDERQIGIGADMRNDVLVPDFGQRGSACLFQQHILPFASTANGIIRCQPFRTA
jgi:hypothetical protein